MLTTGDDDYLVGDADGMLGEAEDGGRRKRVTGCHGRRGGQKMRERKKGGRGMQKGDRYGDAAATKQITGNGNGDNKAWRQNS